MVKNAMLWVAALMLVASAHEMRGQGNAQTVAQTQGQASPQPERKPLTQGTQAPAAGKLAGNWQGTLGAGEGGDGLRTVLKIAGDDGKYHGALYSIDQGGQPIALSSVSLHGSEVSFAVKIISLAYKGTLNPDGDTISGSTTQGKETHTLNLKRVTEEETWAIPEPVKPMAKDAKPGFEVATIKPSKPNAGGMNIDFEGRHLTSENYNVNDMIALAYGLHTRQIIGAPDWFDSELFDIDGIPDVPGEPSDRQAGIMLQKLLVDRFALKFHREQRELSVFAITVAKGGAKMTVSASSPDDPDDDFGFGKLGNLTVRNMNMADFAMWMQSSVTDRPIVDQTGLKGRYDFRLKWTPDDSQFAQFRSTGALPSTKDDPNAPPPRPKLELGLYQVQASLFSLFDCVMRSSPRSPSFFQKEIKGQKLSTEDIELGLQNKCLNETYLFDQEISSRLIPIGRELFEIRKRIDRDIDRLFAFSNHMSTHEILCLEQIRGQLEVYDLEHFDKTAAINLGATQYWPANPSLSYMARMVALLYELFGELKSMVFNNKYEDRAVLFDKVQSFYEEGKYTRCRCSVQGGNPENADDKTWLEWYLTLCDFRVGREQNAIESLDGILQRKPDLVTNRGFLIDVIQNKKATERIKEHYGKKEIDSFYLTITQEASARQCFMEQANRLREYYGLKIARGSFPV